MAEESAFSDLNCGLHRGHAVLSDSDMDNGVDESSHSFSNVPDATVEAVNEGDDGDSVDYEVVKAYLKRAGSEYGISVTPEMENYVMSNSAVLTMDPCSLSWFMLAIVYQNNQKIIPNITGLIEDMRTEVKNLQTVNRSLTLTSSDIIKKITGVKDDIFAGFESLRRTVLDKMVAIPAQVSTAVQSVASNIPSRDITKGIPVAQSQKPQPLAKKEWVEKETQGSTSSTDESRPGGSDTSVQLNNARMKILLKLGGNPMVLKSAPQSVLSKLLPTEELGLLIEQWSSEACQEIKDDVELRLLMLENDICG